MGPTVNLICVLFDLPPKNFTKGENKQQVSREDGCPTHVHYKFKTVHFCRFCER